MSVFSQIHEDDIHLPLSSSPKSDSENHSRDPAFTLEGGHGTFFNCFFFFRTWPNHMQKKGEESMKLNQKRRQLFFSLRLQSDWWLGIGTASFYILTTSFFKSIIYIYQGKNQVVKACLVQGQVCEGIKAVCG